MEKELFNKAKLTEMEWSILNANIEYSVARNKCASILCYIKKHIILNNGAWSKSIDNIFKMYNRSHKYYISTGQLKNIVNRLKDLGLIIIEKVKKRNVYKLPMAKKMPNNLADKKTNESTENKEVEADSKKHRCMDFCKDNNNIYINTTAPAYGEVIADAQEAVVITGQVIKILKVKSKWVINAALNTIKKCYSKIHRLGAFKYISKVILKLQAISKSVYKNTNVYSNAVKQYRAATIPGKEVKFNSFTQRERSKEEWQDLEHKLLGW